jgi:hypothetical protein
MDPRIAAELAALRGNTQGAFAAGQALGGRGNAGNAHLSLAEMLAIVTDKNTKPPTTVNDAFKHPKRVLLPPPESRTIKLYKFNSQKDLIQRGSPEEKGEKPISPWWSAYEPYEHDPGWLQKKAMAAAFKVTIREYGRNTSAIREDWNSLSWLVTITLTVPIWAVFGGFAAMDRRTPGAHGYLHKDHAWAHYGKGRENYEEARLASMQQGNVRQERKGAARRLPGGGTQFYIPNLYSSMVVVHKPEPLVGW